MDHCELKASLIDIVSSWPDRVTKRDCDSKTKINTKGSLTAWPLIAPAAH